MTPPTDRRTNPAMTAPAPAAKPQPGRPETWSGVRSDAGSRVIVDELRAFRSDMEDRIDHVSSDVQQRVEDKLTGYVKALPLIGIIGAAGAVIIGIVLGIAKDSARDAKEGAAAQVQVLKTQLEAQQRAFAELADRVHGTQVDIREFYKADRQRRASSRLEREPPPPVEIQQPWPTKEPPR